MIGGTMALIEMVEKQVDDELAREIVAFGTKRIVEAETPSRSGAPNGARSVPREVQRNGYRKRNGARSRPG